MIKKENKVVAVTLAPYHLRKLNIIRSRTGLSFTSIIRRMVENQKVFGEEALESGDKSS